MISDDNLDHHHARSYHVDLHHADSVWTKSTSFLQVMVSEYPRAEPCVEAVFE